MLSVNILLLNWMIAMFSTTFAKIENESEKYWKFGRYFLIQEYFYRSGCDKYQFSIEKYNFRNHWIILSRPPLVPPFIIIAHIFNLFSYMFKLWCKPKSKSKQGIEFQNAMVSSIHAASRPVSPTHDIRGITVEIEQIKERRRSGKRPFRTYHKSARSFNFPGIGRLLLI